VAFKALPHCPRLQGLLASRVKNNVGLGLTWRQTPVAPMFYPDISCFRATSNLVTDFYSFSVDIQSPVFIFR
jgi:hypothetical protein